MLRFKRVLAQTIQEEEGRGRWTECSSKLQVMQQRLKVMKAQSVCGAVVCHVLKLYGGRWLRHRGKALVRLCGLQAAPLPTGSTRSQAWLAGRLHSVQG